MRRVDILRQYRRRSWVGFDYRDEFVLLLGHRLQGVLTLIKREELSRLQWRF